MGKPLGSGERHPLDRDRDGPHHQPGVRAVPVRYSPGHRPGAHRAVRRESREGPPEQWEQWARAAILAAYAAVWVLTIWLIIRDR